MIPLAGPIAALKVAGTPFKYVGGAIDLATAGDHLRMFPAAYVLPLQDAATSNQSASYLAVSQELTERFGVMYAVRNVKPGAGEAAQEDMRNAIEWARGKVIGLQISAAYDLVQFEGGELVSFADEMMIWLDRFSAERPLRKA